MSVETVVSMAAAAINPLFNHVEKNQIIPNTVCIQWERVRQIIQLQESLQNKIVE